MNSSSEDTIKVQPTLIRARGVEAGYPSRSGTTLGLRGFTATFGPGITGLLGPNGAGKSTFLRSLCGLLPLRGGSLEVGEKIPGEDLSHGGIGFIPEEPPLPSHLTVAEFLQGLGALAGFGPPEPLEASAPHLVSLGNRPLGELSQGQKKQVALAAALLGRPSLLLLDEPTNGLDPLAVRRFRELLLGVRDRGATIIVSSHHLDELQRIADVLVFLREGRDAGSWTREEALRDFPDLETLFAHVFLESEDE